MQNAFVLKNPGLPDYTFERTPDNSGFATTDGLAIQPNGSNAIPTILRNNDPMVTPTVGFILEF